MINDSRHQHNERGITDDCSDSDRNSLPELDLLNLRVANGDEHLRHRIYQNLGKQSKGHGEKFHVNHSSGHRCQNNESRKKYYSDHRDILIPDPIQGREPSNNQRRAPKHKGAHTIRLNGHPDLDLERCCEHCHTETVPEATEAREVVNEGLRYRGRNTEQGNEVRYRDRTAENGNELRYRDRAAENGNEFRHRGRPTESDNEQRYRDRPTEDDRRYRDRESESDNELRYRNRTENGNELRHRDRTENGNELRHRDRTENGNELRHRDRTENGNELRHRDRTEETKNLRFRDTRKEKLCPSRKDIYLDRRMNIRFSEKGNLDVGNPFPFKETPSGNFKVIPDQVVFSSKKVSVLVADPDRTKVNIQRELESSEFRGIMPPIPSKLFQRPQGLNKPEGGDVFSKKVLNRGVSESEDDTDDGVSSLRPEMKLERLGYTYNNIPIDYSKLILPLKTNLYQELYRRISNYLNTDVQVVIGQEEFSCHRMVLESYSKYFQENLKPNIELPAENVTVNAFVVIYDWMITGPSCIQLLKRDNVLDVYVASKYLKIKELEEQCWSFIDSEQVFTEDTAFLLYMEAKKKNLKEAQDLMLPRIQAFFLMLVASQDFCELDAEEVCVLLKSSYISVNCEMEVLLSVVRWVKYDWENRMKNAVKLASCVRFGLIAPWQLVDIKRNPENPELLDIMTIPEITKMADDGLSFVIIKYWYGHESSDYQHWINLLGLTEPHERNWAGKEKNYVTYRQFLAFLGEYRRENLLEQKKQKQKKQTDSPELSSPVADYESPSASAPKNFILTNKQHDRLSFLQDKDAYESDFSGTNDTLSHTITEDEAATTIQSAYRGYKTRQRITKERDKEREKIAERQRHNKHFTKSLKEKGLNIIGQNLKVLSMFSQSGKKTPANLSPSLSKETLLIKGSLFSHDRECVLVFGGLDPHTEYGVNRNTAKDIYRFLPESNSWDYVGELPEPRHHHSTAFFHGKIYLVGGTNPTNRVNTDEDNKCSVTSSVWSYNPVTRTWEREHSMITGRKNFGLVVSHMKLYAIGGQDKNGSMLKSVERLEPGGNWQEVTPMTHPRMGMACAKYREHIWVAGGMCGSKRSPLSSIVECYDTRNNQWTLIENLRHPRCFSCLFPMNDKLYLIGGAGRQTDKDRNTTSVGAIDVWDGHDKEWKLKAELAIPRHGHSVAYLGTQILVIGGVTTVYMRALSNIECYCCERCTWVRGLSPLPTTLSGHSSVTLPPASLM